MQVDRSRWVIFGKNDLFCTRNTLDKKKNPPYTGPPIFDQQDTNVLCLLETFDRFAVAQILILIDTSLCCGKIVSFSEVRTLESSLQRER